jgi:hypothetical protein
LALRYFRFGNLPKCRQARIRVNPEVSQFIFGVMLELDGILFIADPTFFHLKRMVNLTAKNTLSAISSNLAAP